MRKLNYEFENLDKKHLKEGMKKLNHNNLIKKRLRFFQKYNKGTNLRMNDPSKPENWSSQKNSLKKFIYDKEYKNFMLEVKKYQEKLKNM